MSDMTGWLLVWPILLPVLASALAVEAWGRERTQTLILSGTTRDRVITTAYRSLGDGHEYVDWLEAAGDALQ